MSPFLPLQPFADPQRNWFVRATVLDTAGKVDGHADSPPFCRLAHEPTQPPIERVIIKNGMLYVNGKPWMPWGVCYGHVPATPGRPIPGGQVPRPAQPARLDHLRRLHRGAVHPQG